MGKSGKSGSSGGKKILIGIAIVVLVAILVVVILLCIPPNTYNAIETLNRSTQSSFLKNSSESADFSDFKSKLGKNTTLKSYSTEVSDIRQLTLDVNNILSFYNYHIVFAEDNNKLKDNYKPIKNNLNSAKEYQKDMDSILSSARNLDAENTTSQLRNKYIDFRNKFTKWLNCNRKAISALSSAYQGAMGNVIERNAASKLTLNAVNNYLDVIYSEFNRLNTSDTKGGSVSSYTYLSHDKVELFTKFIGQYLVKEGLSNTMLLDIGKYYFNEAIQTKYANINKFFDLYKESNFKSVITSATTFSTNEKGFAYKNETVEDTEKILTKVKDFLGGINYEN